MHQSSEEYETILASDVDRDGMGLELNDRHPEITGRPQPLLEAFWFDQDDRFVVTVYSAPLELPFDVVERFIQLARQRLPRVPPIEDM